MEKVYCPTCGTEIGWKMPSYKSERKGTWGGRAQIITHRNESIKPCPNGCDRKNNDKARIKSLIEIGITELKQKC